MDSTCIDPVLHNLGLLKDNLRGGRNPDNYVLSSIIGSCEALQLKLPFLRTFIVCATKWRNNNDVYPQSKKDMKVSLHSFLSNIEDEVNNYGAQIHSLCLRNVTELEKDPYSAFLFVHFHRSIKSFKQEIIKAYLALSGCSSSQFINSCMRDDELVDFIQLLVQNLMDLLRPLFFWTPGSFDHALHAQVEALVDKLTFLKNFVCLAKLQGLENSQLGDLLIHTELVALGAARLSYLCSFYKEDEEVRSPKMCFLISELIQMIKPVDARISDTYISILRASRSSPLTHPTEMDKQTIGNFNDSLICCLWELLRCYTSFADVLNDQMKLLYEGLRFLRTILREPDKIMDKLNEDITVVIAEAGIIIFSLSRHQLGSGYVDALELRSVLFCTNREIKLIEAQNVSSGAVGSLLSNEIIIQQVGGKTSSPIFSKAKTPRIHEAMVDLHDEVKTVKDRLISGSNQLEIIPIVGRPGLGKTTLAKTVIDDPSIKYHFHISIWCCVSQSYNKKNVLLQVMGCDASLKEMDESDLALNVYQNLRKNKFLVVFDDVWDIAVWDDLKKTFPNDKNGSRILITSRFSSVAAHVDFEEPHNLRPLTSTESWELLQKKVFGKEGCPKALWRHGIEIAKNCKGLPLTVVIIAGILATVEHDVWKEVAKSLASTIVYEMDRQCENTLELSYRNLPSYLKPCLLYFGALREDQEIRIRKLTWLWMAEGFVQSTESKRLEDVAEGYLNELIGRNLVMVTKQRSIGGAKACCIHGLIHEFCRTKAKEENFLQVLHGYDELSVFIEPPNLQRLSICSSQEEFNKSMLFCAHARSLLFFNNIEEYQTIADISFIGCCYKHLRVLNIEQIRMMHKVFPNEITLLVRLRYLAVQACIMNSVPTSIANLTNLESFLLTCYSGIISLPDTIWNLKKLRHLHITEVTCLLPAGIPENSSCLDNLDTFSCLSVSLEHLEDIVKKIPNVRRLRIKLAENPSTYCNTTLAMDSLSQLERLESLEVSMSLGLLSWKGHIEYCFPSTLRELSLRRLRIPWSKMSVIEDLPNLEVLKLLKDSFMGERWEMKGGFPKLRFLKLENVNIVEWTDDNAYDSDNFLPRLEKLVLVGTHLNFEKVPSCLYCIPTLEMIQVGSLCRSEIVRRLVWEIEKEQRAYGNEKLKILMD